MDGVSVQRSSSQKTTLLEDRGLLLNERTGRTVKVGGSTYQRLLQEGYQVTILMPLMISSSVRSFHPWGSFGKMCFCSTGIQAPCSFVP